MKNFKLIIVAMLVIAMSLVLFAACGDKENLLPQATPVGTGEPAGQKNRKKQKQLTKLQKL